MENLMLRQWIYQRCFELEDVWVSLKEEIKNLGVNIIDFGIIQIQFELSIPLTNDLTFSY
jgi:hypothetical protein